MSRAGGAFVPTQSKRLWRNNSNNSNNKNVNRPFIHSKGGRSFISFLCFFSFLFLAPPFYILNAPTECENHVEIYISEDNEYKYTK